MKKRFIYSSLLGILGIFVSVLSVILGLTIVGLVSFIACNGDGPCPGWTDIFGDLCEIFFTIVPLILIPLFIRKGYEIGKGKESKNLITKK